MEVTWNGGDSHHEEYLLAGDIGGSNTNMALVGRTGAAYTVLAKYRFDSPEVVDFSTVVRQVVENINATDSQLLPSRGCLCAAGPIYDNKCTPTNLNWEIDGNALSSEFSIPIAVMNDFQAICYGVPLLDVRNPDQILPVPHRDGSVPAPTGHARAVAGAGTGLGVGFISRVNNAFVSLPSEGGHSGFAPFDEESSGLYSYVASRYTTVPGTELFLSGRGMTEIYKYFRDVKKRPLTGAFREIEEADDTDKPPIITRNTPTDSGCREIMLLFIKIYGHFAARTSLFFIPRAGMYIAGGIVVRHAKLFLEDNNFMSAFENSYNPVMQALLKTIPVYIVNDYSISLLGAAHAAVAQPDLGGA